MVTNLFISLFSGIFSLLGFIFKPIFKHVKAFKDLGMDYKRDKKFLERFNATRKRRGKFNDELL